MKTRTIAYWTTTALLAFAFAAGGLADLSGAPAMTEAFTHLGYPAYVMLLIGAWKVLGALAILAPGMPRLKEWAYAGIVFDLSGAVVSHASVGDGVDQLVAPIALLAIAAASWALRPASRVLGRPIATTSRSRALPVADAHASLA